MNPLHTVFLVYIIFFYQLESGKVILNHSPFPPNPLTEDHKYKDGKMSLFPLVQYQARFGRNAAGTRPAGFRPNRPAKGKTLQGRKNFPVPSARVPSQVRTERCRHQAGRVPSEPAGEGEELTSGGSLPACQQTEGVCVCLVILVLKARGTCLLLLMWMCVLFSVG